MCTVYHVHGKIVKCKVCTVHCTVYIVKLFYFMSTKVLMIINNLENEKNSNQNRL